MPSTPRRRGSVVVMRWAKWVAAAVLIALVACTPKADEQLATVPSPAPSAVAGGAMPSALATPGARAPIPDGELLQPLTALGPCKANPKGKPPGSVEGLVAPEKAVITRTTN